MPRISFVLKEIQDLLSEQPQRAVVDLRSRIEEETRN